jgi:hypothetical protein
LQLDKTNELKAQKEILLYKWLTKIRKNDSSKIWISSFVKQNKTENQEYLNTIKKDLFSNMPFLKAYFSKKRKHRSAIYLNKGIVTHPSEKIIF